ncbi:MAG: elongation factor EF-2 [Nitrososphaeria archaeon]|nr:elongation factor EF-2 [Nitrososphaeria archaeon]
MPRYKQTSEIVSILKDRSRVRNIGIIAHVDHGKTTMSDSLLAASGLLSPSMAGKALALDYLEEEQKRGITIKTANISLLHEMDGTSYVINLIDTPGHVDFTGKVTRALRAIDGAIVVVDAVEEVMVQTETVTRQALAERVRPLLYINKVDRLITELRLPLDEIQKRLARVIARFNSLIDIFGEEQYKEEWKISPEKNNVAFGSAKDRWGFTPEMAQKEGLSFKDILDYYETGNLEELRQRALLHRAMLDMVTRHIPPPLEAQRYRIEKIWRGDLKSELGQAMLNCDENGPIAFMVTSVIVDEKAGVVATGRLLSGTLASGREVYLINNASKDRILQVSMYMGPYREIVDEMIAGNIPAALGLDKVFAGETVSSHQEMIPFEAIKYVSEPVVTIAIEPESSRDLPRLISALRKLAIEDPNLVVKIDEETGEYLLSGMGVLHLEISIHSLEDQGLKVMTSQPIVVYRETVSARSEDFPGKSPNKHNRFILYVERLEDEILELITQGEIPWPMDRRGLARILSQRGWPMDEARRVWEIDNRGNILVNLTKGVQYLDETKSMIISAFNNVSDEGILCREPTRGQKIVLLDAELHEDPAHRTFAQIFPAIRRAIFGAILTARPSIYEPVMKLSVQVPADLIGKVSGLVSSKRGAITSIDQREYFAVVNGEIPLAETFDLSQVLRGATGGKAFWSLVFEKWKLLPRSLLSEVIKDIRKRKGLSERLPKAGDFRPT